MIGLPLEGEEVDVASLPSADAIVLLGGGVGVHDKCGRAEFFQGADRVWMAARLWKAGKAPVMTLSGAGARGEVPILEDMGVKTNAFIRLDAARNTEEEARMIQAALHKASPKVLLVTSAWHMPRAKMLFERAGLEVIPAPTDYEMHYAVEEPIQFSDIFPGYDDLQRNSCAIKEWVALCCYWIKGGFR